MYNKLFTKILDSSIWLESDATRIVWITFLAAMDEDGVVRFGSIRNLARRANVSVEAAVDAIKRLESPDEFNLDQPNQGRRIEKVPDGWLVLNAKRYNEMITRAVVREQTRIRTARYRDRNASTVTNQKCDNDVTHPYEYENELSASEGVQGELLEAIPPDPEDVKRLFVERGHPESEAVKFFNFYESKGWLVGKSKMKKWRCAAANWIKGIEERGFKPKPVKLLPPQLWDKYQSMIRDFKRQDLPLTPEMEVAYQWAVDNGRAS